MIPMPFSFFFFNDTATTEIYTLSLHDALPTSACACASTATSPPCCSTPPSSRTTGDRKSTRLNSSHVAISYAVFCLKKKKRHSVHRRARRRARCPADEVLAGPNGPDRSTFFFFNDTATTEIYTLSLHDALPISRRAGPR